MTILTLSIHFISADSLNSKDCDVSKNSSDEKFLGNKSSPSASPEIDKKKRKRSSKFACLLSELYDIYYIFALLSASPFGKCIRKRWTEEEKNIVHTAFKHHITAKTQPSYKEIQKLKEANPDVLTRNCATIKTWINNQHKKKA